MIEGKIAIITGESRGVGKATAMALSKHGACVVLAARTQNDLERVADEIQASGGKALVIRADVTLLDQVQQLVNQTLDHYGKIDILINNSGIGIFESVIDSDVESWNKVLDSNLKSVYLCSKAVLPPMFEQQSGQIINILSIASKVAFQFSSAYCAAKSAALAFTKVLREEIREHGIRVTAVLPGSINSPFWAGMETHPDFDLMLTPEHIAQTIVNIVKSPSDMTIEEVTVTPPLGIL